MPEKPPRTPELSRLKMLERTALLIGSISASSVLATLAPTRIWALELKTLSKSDGNTILQFARVLYPHKKLDTAVYALVVKDLDAAAAKDAKTAAVLANGCASLNAGAGGNFSAASADKQLAAVKRAESMPFFDAVRSQCVTSLYNNEMAFAVFGYEGPSWPKGGYIHRGFNDLAWLPNPPEDASPTLGAR